MKKNEGSKKRTVPVDRVVSQDLESRPGFPVEITVKATSPEADPAAWLVLSWLSTQLSHLGHEVQAFDDGDQVAAPVTPKPNPPVRPRIFKVSREFAARPSRWKRFVRRLASGNASKKRSSGPSETATTLAARRWLESLSPAERDQVKKKTAWLLKSAKSPALEALLKG